MSFSVTTVICVKYVLMNFFEILFEILLLRMSIGRLRHVQWKNVT